MNEVITSLPNGNAQRPSVYDHIRSIFLRCKCALPEKFIVVLLPILVTIFFGVILADIEEYANDHDISFIGFTAIISISFAFIYVAIHAIKDQILKLLSIDEDEMSSSIIWMIMQIAIGLIAFFLYWYSLKSFISFFSLFNGAEKVAFEWDLEMWIISIYLTSFLFNHEEFPKRFLKCGNELRDLFRRNL